MNDLLSFTIEAHGGLENWNRFDKISTRIYAGGATWERKQQVGLMRDVEVTVDTRTQNTLFRPNYDQDIQFRFDPQRVVIENNNGQVIEELLQPRRSFDGQDRTSPWSRPQAVYFSGYAMWTYLNAPFNFAGPGYEASEIEPWQEKGETWRRLKVVFPEHIATHNREQVFYIDKDGLIRRHDYNVEISGNAGGAHYLYDHRDFQGVKVPTRRSVFIRNADNTSMQPEPVLIDIRLEDVRLFS